MKKLFTLILSLVAFSTVSFASTEMDLSQWGTAGWGSTSYDADTYTMTLTSDWAGRGIWLGGVDYSAYSSVTITFTSEIASTIKLVVEEYDETNTNSSEFASASINGSGDATAEQSITIELGETATNISQMYIQAGAAGTLTLVSAILKTADEEEVVEQADCVELYTTSTSIWQSDDYGTYYYELPYTISGWSGTYLGTDAYKGTPELTASGLGVAGNVLVFYFTDTTEDDSWGFKIVEGHWGAAYAAVNYTGDSDDPETDPFVAYDLEAVGGLYALEITDAMLTNISTGQYWGGEFIIQGDGLTLTKVEVMTPEAYATSIKGVTVAEPVKTSDAVYNLSGQRVSNSYKGLVIKNGKKVIVK